MNTELYSIVQLTRESTNSSFDDSIVTCSLTLSCEILEIIKSVNNYLEKINDIDIEDNCDLNEYLNSSVELKFKIPRQNTARFYKNWDSFLQNAVFSSMKDFTEFYLFEENVFFSTEESKCDNKDEKLSNFKALVSVIPAFKKLAHYSDEKNTQQPKFVYLSNEYKKPLTLQVKITPDLLSEKLDFVILESLIAKNAKKHIHYSDKLSIFHSTLHEHLQGKDTTQDPFITLMTTWNDFTVLYQNNYTTYLSGFSFHKAKKEIIETEIELSEKLTNLTSDITFKLFSVPASTIALVIIMQKGVENLLVLLMLLVGLVVTILLMYGLLNSQKNKYKSLVKSKELMFKSIDGKQENFPLELQSDIIEMETRLDEHFSSTNKWLKRFTITIFLPLVIFIILFISA